MAQARLVLNRRRQQLVRNAAGYDVWQVTETPTHVPVSETALLLCDVWDSHWCRGASERLAKLLPRMDEVTCAARRQGVLVIHAPSDTLAFYAESPARRRVLDLPKVEPPPDLPHEDPPIAVQTHDPTSCDTPPDKPRRTWSRQHPAITIDESLDLVSDNGRELYSVYQTRGIRHVIILGVHTNMCVLNRSFGIKQLVRWGFDTTLVRDLTDAQYSPAQAPYVPHEEGTRLVVEYIEKFWCPTIHSDDLLK